MFLTTDRDTSRTGLGYLDLEIQFRFRGGVLASHRHLNFKPGYDFWPSKVFEEGHACDSICILQF